ncbi:MAG: hypothetical protein L0170_05425, partial [Acidobacteria bacterium]|nr:hypothetical protein [Acidobacteriota bacterium]
MREKKLPELSDADLDEILSKAPPTISEGMRQRMKDEIAADLAAIENHDEFARIKAEDQARSEAVDQARRARRERERVLAEKRRFEAAQAEPGQLKPTTALQAVLEIVEPEVMQWAPTAEDLAW